MTVHHWGEDPSGKWTLKVADQPKNGSASYSRRRGRLISWSLILYGVAGDRLNHHNTPGNSEVSRGAEAAQKNTNDTSEQARHVGTSEVQELMEEEEASSESVQIQSKEEMGKKQNARRRKWLLEKGFDPKDVEFLIALFETEQEENKRKSAGENSPKQQKKSEIPDYRTSRHYGGSSENRGNWWRRRYDRGQHSSPSRRNVENIETDQQRIVNEDATDAAGIESWRALIDELSAILEDEWSDSQWVASLGNFFWMDNVVWYQLLAYSIAAQLGK